VGLTLIGVKDARFQQGPTFQEAPRFDRDRVDVPFVVLEDLRAETATVLQQALDVIWQAGGKARAPVP
jgi:hypothetical protein